MHSFLSERKIYKNLFITIIHVISLFNYFSERSNFSIKTKFARKSLIRTRIRKEKEVTSKEIIINHLHFESRKPFKEVPVPVSTKYRVAEAVE